LLNTLMWSGLIEIDHIGFEEAMELPLVEDQEMIQTCSPHAPQKPFTDGIRLRRPVRDSKHLDATCCRHSRKIRVEFPVLSTGSFWANLLHILLNSPFDFSDYPV